MDDVWEWHTYEPGSPVPPPLEPNEPEKLAASRFALVLSQEIEEAKNAEVKRERVLLMFPLHPCSYSSSPFLEGLCCVHFLGPSLTQNNLKTIKI